MSQTQSADPSKQKVHSLCPHLICDDAAGAMEFYKRAFGAVEVMRLPGPDGKFLHGCVSVGSSSVMLVDESPEHNMLGPKALGGTAVTMHFMVDDVDAFVARAAQAGAKIVMPVADMFWGDRYGVIEDPYGHRWSVATHLRDMTPEEVEQAMRQTYLEHGKECE